MRGKKHPDDVRARAIAALLLGATVAEVAAQLSLPSQTVSDYKNEIPDEKFGELRIKRGARLDEMVFDYMVKSLKALSKQTEAASDLEYLKTYSPSELATLHGVMADKTVRLLEACSRAGVAVRQLESGTA